MLVRPIAVALVALLACSCGKKESASSEPATKKSEAESKTATKDDDGAEKPKPKGKAKAKAPKGHTIAGVTVPPWSQEHVGAKCKIGAEADAKIKAWQKGNGPEIEDESTDVPKLVKELAGDCSHARPALAMALNSGGYLRYAKKKYKEANHWWARALAVDPGLLVARYNLASGLALVGEKADAIWNLQELARAAEDGHATAANYLEKAKTDADLESVRTDPAVVAAIAVSKGGLVGPRKEPELAAKLPALLPQDWRKGETEQGGNVIPLVYKPTLVDVWTWRPDSSTELLVGRVVDYPSSIPDIGKPLKEQTDPWGGIAVLQMKDEKPTLLLAQRTAHSAPSAVAAGKGGAVNYSFAYGWPGSITLHGTLSWKGGKVVVDQQDPMKLAGADEPAAECKDGEVPVGEGGACLKECAADTDCAKGKSCLPGSFEMEGGGTAHVKACF